MPKCLIEEHIAQLQAVKTAFPNATMHIINNAISYQDKSVNQIYTDLDFINNYGIYVLPYCKVESTCNGNTILAKIYSKPKTNKLVYKEFNWANNKRFEVIRFAKLTDNLTKRMFNPNMIQLCHEKIIDFIQANPSAKIETKHLDPRLKMLLSFI